MAQVESSDEFYEHNELLNSMCDYRLCKKDCPMKIEKPKLELTGHFSFSDILRQQIILDQQGQ
jgi:hypothetical protein